MTPILRLPVVAVVIVGIVVGNIILGRPKVGIAAGVLLTAALGIGTLVGNWLASREQ